MKLSGELSPGEVGILLRVDRKTIISWCRRALRGDESRLQRSAIRLCPLTGYYYLQESYVRELRARVLAENTIKKVG